jgi:hypothetical protein
MHDAGCMMQVSIVYLEACILDHVQSFFAEASWTSIKNR